MQYTEKQLDAIKELINIGIGRASGALNDLLDAHIKLQVPHVEIISSRKLVESTLHIPSETLSTILLDFSGEFSGSASLLFPKQSAANLISALTGEETQDNPDLDSLKVGTLTEVGNIVLNGVMGSIGNILEQKLNYKLPKYKEQNIYQILDREADGEERAVLLAQASFSSEKQEIRGDVLIIFELEAFSSLLASIDRAFETGF